MLTGEKGIVSRSWTLPHLFGDKPYRIRLIKTKKRFNVFRTIVRPLANEARSLPISDAACSGTCAVSDFHCICRNVTGQSSFRQLQALSNIRGLLNFLTKKQMKIALKECDLSIPDKANTPTRRIYGNSCRGYDCRR